jgi:hypothetical protein
MDGGFSNDSPCLDSYTITVSALHRYVSIIIHNNSPLVPFRFVPITLVCFSVFAFLGSTRQRQLQLPYRKADIKPVMNPPREDSHGGGSYSTSPGVGSPYGRSSNHHNSSHSNSANMHNMQELGRSSQSSSSNNNNQHAATSSPLAAIRTPGQSKRQQRRNRAEAEAEENLGLLSPEGGGGEGTVASHRMLLRSASKVGLNQSGSAGAGGSAASLSRSGSCAKVFFGEDDDGAADNDGVDNDDGDDDDDDESSDSEGGNDLLLDARPSDVESFSPRDLAAAAASTSGLTTASSSSSNSSGNSNGNGSSAADAHFAAMDKEDVARLEKEKDAHRKRIRPIDIIRVPLYERVWEIGAFGQVRTI